MEEKKKKIKLHTIIVIILSVLLVGFACYIAYNKTLKNDNVVEENNKVNEENNQEEQEEVDEEIKVISAFSYHGDVKYNGDCLINTKTVERNIDIPKITSTKPNATLFNKEIAEKFEEEMKVNKDTVVGNHFTEVKYDYLIKNNYIFMDVRTTDPGYCSSGGSHSKNYFYDIVNDKILTMEEGFKAFGFTLQDLNDSNESEEDITFEECENIECGACGLRIEDNKLVPFYARQCT